MEIYWDQMALTTKDAFIDLKCNGVDANPQLLYRDLKDGVSSGDLDLFYESGDGKSIFTSSKDGGGLVGIPLGGSVSSVWAHRIPTKVLKSDDHTGVYLFESAGVYMKWIHRRIWVEEFVKKYKHKLRENGLDPKNYTIHLDIQDPTGVRDAFSLVDAIHIRASDGIIYGDSFLLPMGGYLDLEGNVGGEDMNETLDIAADMVSVERKLKETKDEFLHRVQVNVFNYEIEKQMFLVAGNQLQDFNYKGKTYDEDKVYSLAVIRGSIGEKSIIALTEEVETNIQQAVRTGDVDNVVESMGRLYSILLARVEFGNQLDNFNQYLSTGVSSDVDKALKHGVKLTELIGNIRKQRFDEKLNYAKLKLEEEKVELQRELQSDGDDTSEKQIYDVLDKIQDEDITDFVKKDTNNKLSTSKNGKKGSKVKSVKKGKGA